MTSWEDISSWLATDKPIETAYASGDLLVYFPEVHKLFGIPQPEEHHPEIDCGIHIILVLEQAKKLSSDPGVWFAALCHDLGKGLTPIDNYPKHINHERLGKEPLEEIILKYQIPSDIAQLALKSCTEHLRAHKSLEMRPGNIIQWFMDNDWYNNHSEFEKFLIVSESDALGRKGKSLDLYVQRYFLKDFYEASKDMIDNIVDVDLKTREDILGCIIPPLKKIYGDSNNGLHRKEYISDKYRLCLNKLPENYCG